jgi:hypothetical protein
VSPFKPFDNTEFAAHSEREGSRLNVHLWGNADLRAKEALDALMVSIDQEATSAPVDEVVVNLRELVFMNSSCLKALVTWLSNVQRRPPTQQYKIRFLREPAAHWQVRSLGALAAFAPGIVQVE